MEVDCGDDGFSPKLDGWLRVKHHSSNHPGDGTDHSLSNSILVVRVRCALIICCTAGGEHRAEGLIVILPSAFVSLTPSDLIPQSSDLGLKSLVGGGASFRLLIWEHPYQCEEGIVVNK